MTVEVEPGGDVTVLVHCIPLVGASGVNGAVILSRDISELRRRDRLLLSKDATIREIHHRVKNNLQTVSALLRLQGRRLAGQESKAAIDESVRRIRSIALVHDMLSRDSGEAVPFVDILRPLVRMVEDGLVSADQQVSFAVEGGGGIVPAQVATPLAVVLNELLQNAVDHAFDAEVEAWWCRSPPTTIVSKWRSGTTVAAFPRVSTSSLRPAWACRSSGRWWSRTSAARSPCHRGNRDRVR